MDSQAKELILLHIEKTIAGLQQIISRTRPTGDAKEQATTWWQRGQVHALENLISDIKEDKEAD